MAINRFYKSEPVQFQYPETALQPLMVALDSRQKRYDTALDLSEQLKTTFVSALPQDRAVADQWSQNLSSNIDEMIANVDGDYSSIYGNIRKLRSQVAQDLSPSGKMGAIQNHFTRFQEALAQGRERLKKGDITQGQLSDWVDYTMRSYSGVGEKDPITGNFNPLNTEDISNYISGYDVAQKIAKDLPSIFDAKEFVGIDPSGNWIVKRGEKTETVSPERVKAAVEGALYSNKEYMDYLSQMFRFKGREMGLEDFAANVDLITDNLIDVYARQSSWKTKDLKHNPFALKGYDPDALQGPRDSVSGAANTAFPTFKIGEFRLSDLSAQISGGAYTLLRMGDPGTVLKQSQNLTKLLNQPSLNMPHNSFTQRGKSNIPEGLHPAYDNMVSDINSDASLKTDQDKNKALRDRWNTYVNDQATQATTELLFNKKDNEVLKSGIWQQAVDNATWYEIKPDGSVTEVSNKRLPSGIKTIKEEPNKHLPASIRTDGPGGIGYKVKVGNKTYLAANVSDRITSSYAPLQNLKSPLFTGQESQPELLEIQTPEGAVQVGVRTRPNPDYKKGGIIIEYMNETGKWSELPGVDANSFINKLRQ